MLSATGWPRRRVLPLTAVSMRAMRPGLPRRGSSGSSGRETLDRDLHGAVAGLPEILSQSSLSKKTLRRWTVQEFGEPEEGVGLAYTLTRHRLSIVAPA